jgi:anti-anti-sigma factor
MYSRANRCQLEVDLVGLVVVARFIDLDAVDDAGVNSLGEQLYRLVDARGCRHIVVDFDGATRVDSSVVGKVVGLYRRAKAEGGRVALCGLSPHVLAFMQMLQLTRLMPAFPGRREGVAALAPPTNDEPTLKDGVQSCSC